jgi:hypothetical protein
MDATRADVPITSRFTRVGLALLPGLAAALAAWPILENGFVGDDFGYLLELVTVGPRDLLTAPFGGHMLFVRNLAFYLCFLAFGMEPTGYFVVALVTHVAVSLLVGTLARRLTGDALVSCLAGVLFAVAPANHGTLGWYSVYGHALAAAAVLLGLLVVAPSPGDDAALSPRAAGVAAAAMLVASQSFGTGAAVAMVFPAVAVLLRPGTLRAPASRAILAAVPVLVLLAWMLMTGLRTRLNPAGIESTRAMALLATDYPRIGLVAMHLLAMGLDGLLLGLPFPSTDYGNALSVVSVVLFGAAVSATLARGSAPTRRMMLACLLMAGICYLVVSAGRASLYVALAKDDLLSALEQGTRYHYLAQSVLALAVALILAELGRHVPWSAGPHAALVGAWTVWALAGPLLFDPHVPRLEEKSVPRIRARLEQAIRSRPVGSTVCLPVEPAAIAWDFPGTLGVFMLYYPTNDFEGRRVRFVSSNPRVLALREVSGRMRELLLPEGTCPPRDGVSE